MLSFPSWSALPNGVKNYAWGTITSGTLCLHNTGDKAIFTKCQATAPQQQWLFTGAGHLISKADDGHVVDECVDLPTEAKGKSGSELQMWSCAANSSSMRWKLVMVSAGSPAGTNAVFQFQSLAYRSLCLDSAGGNGKNIVAKTCDKNAATQMVTLSKDYAFAQAQLMALGLNDTANWMNNVFTSKENTNLKDVIIPGTHDSGTYADFSTISTTQTKSIYAQLLGGIRYIDLRIGNNNNIVHGIENGAAGTALKAIADIKLFAKVHPKEIIFVDMHETPTKEDAIKNLATTINNELSPFMVPAMNMPELTFKKLWDSKKNIVLLVRDYKTFMASATMTVAPWNKTLNDNSDEKTFINSKNNVWGEVWPDTTDFKIIFNKINTALAQSKKTKWLMGQLLRTPRIGDAILTTFKLKGGPLGLVTEKTDDGNFNLQIDKWVYDWEMKGMPVNFLAADFFELSNLVPMAIWLNHKR